MAVFDTRAGTDSGERRAPDRPQAADGPAEVLPDRRRVMTRALALVCFAGGALKFAWLALPHEAHAQEPGIAAMALVAWACGTVLLTVPPRFVTDRVLNAIVAITTVEISAALWFTEDPMSEFAFFYLWTIPYAFVFFSLAEAAFQAALVAICLALTITLRSGLGGGAAAWTSRDVTRYLAVLGTVLIVGLLVRRVVTWLHEAQAFMRHGFENSALGMSFVSAALRYLEVNEAYAQILGRKREEVVGLGYEDVTHPDDLDVVRREAAFAWSEDERAHQVIEKRFVRPDGQVVPVISHTGLLRDHTGRRRYLVSQVEDITDRRRREEAAARHAAQQAAIARLGEVALREELADLLGEVVRTVAATVRVELVVIVEVSPEGEELVADYGGREGLRGRRPISREPWRLAEFTLRVRQPVVSADLRHDPRFRPSALLRDEGAVSGVTVPVGLEERAGVLGAFATARRTFSEDEVTFLQAVANVLADAIARDRNDQAMRHAALHDPLTGLSNRALVIDHLEHALNVLRRERTTVAVLLLDLDRFKIINDTLGHAAGDQLLMTVAARLHEAVRPGDTVGRLGGDEFTVVCERVSGPHDAVALAERISAAVRRPVVLDGDDHFVSTSIGIAMTTAVEDTPDSLLRAADAAMYEAKVKGPGGFEIFDERMRDQVLHRLRTETELIRGLHAGELRVHYQPVVDLESRRTVSVEALVRWLRSDGHLTPPGAFLPLAEETGLIGDIGLWVLSEACAHVAAWQREFDAGLQLTVNVSARQIADPVFPAEAGDIAWNSGLRRGSLGLEVSESVLSRDSESSVAVLTGLHEHGLRLVLDDFGRGHSSLGDLRRVPFDALKIDRSLVRGLGVDSDDSALVDAVLKVGQSLGVDAVAEGVETDEQIEVLRTLSCRHAQGYRFAHPLPAEELEAFLAGRAR